jgi:hypothetical protein
MCCSTAQQFRCFQNLSKFDFMRFETEKTFQCSEIPPEAALLLELILPTFYTLDYKWRMKAA